MALHPTAMFGITYMIVKKSLQNVCFFKQKNLTLTQ